jgi:hypothetical protein
VLLETEAELHERVGRRLAKLEFQFAAKSGAQGLEHPLWHDNSACWQRRLRSGPAWDSAAEHEGGREAFRT